MALGVLLAITYNTMVKLALLGVVVYPIVATLGVAVAFVLTAAIISALVQGVRLAYAYFTRSED